MLSTTPGVLLVVVPWLVLFFVYCLPGMFKIAEPPTQRAAERQARFRDSTARLLRFEGGNLLVAYAFPCMLLFVLSFFTRGNLLQPEVLAKWAALVAAAMCFAGGMIISGNKKAQVFITISLFSASYGWGLVSIINKQLDTSGGVERVAVVYGTHTKHSIRSAPSYLLDLQASPDWQKAEPSFKTASLAVGRLAYNSAGLGDKVCVKFHGGALGARWYYFDVPCENRGLRSD